VDQFCKGHFYIVLFLNFIRLLGYPAANVINKLSVIRCNGAHHHKFGSPWLRPPLFFSEIFNGLLFRPILWMYIQN